MKTQSLTRAAIMVVAVLTFAGCASGGQDPSPSSTDATAPTGTAVVIEPLESIPGAKRYEFEGLGIDVPAGMDATSDTLSDGSIQVQLRTTGAPRATVLVTVTDQAGATDTIINVTSDLAAVTLAGSGVATDIVETPATWAGVDYVVMIRCVLTVDVEGVEEVKDGTIATMAHPDRTKIVAVSAEAPAGTLEESEAYAALRTLRFDG